MLGNCITVQHRDRGPHEHDPIVCVSWVPVADRKMEDRRQAPRREVERTLHYARELLIAEALSFANGAPEVPTNLQHAANAYRAAEKEAHR